MTVKLLHSDARFCSWLLLEAGARRIKTGYRAKQPTPALTVRKDLALADRTTWELIADLDEAGWTHVVKNKDKDDPYVPGQIVVHWSGSVSLEMILCVSGICWLCYRVQHKCFTGRHRGSIRAFSRAGRCQFCSAGELCPLSV